MQASTDRKMVDILLATYNGERFIEEQLQSLSSQTMTDWRLIARDDGSRDDTLRHLLAFRDKHPDRVVVLQDDLGKLGACQNYGHLMQHSDADYVAFCDQDDVWIAEKLELELGKMRALEEKNGSAVPHLVFSDLTVVDKLLKPIDRSFWDYQNLAPDDSRHAARLMLRNVVTGCTMLLNRALLRKALPLPEQAFMHDWWVALVASVFGRVDFIAQPTVLYRQHGENVLGAKGAVLLTHPRRIVETLASVGVLRQRFSKVFAQGSAFSDRFASEFSRSDRKRLDAVLTIPHVNYFRRAYIGWKSGALRNDVPRMALFLALSRGSRPGRSPPFFKS